MTYYPHTYNSLDVMRESCAITPQKLPGVLNVIQGVLLLGTIIHQHFSVHTTKYNSKFICFPCYWTAVGFQTMHLRCNKTRKYHKDSALKSNRKCSQAADAQGDTVDNSYALTKTPGYTRLSNIPTSHDSNWIIWQPLHTTWKEADP